MIALLVLIALTGCMDTTDAESVDDCSGSGTGALPTKMCPSAYVLPPMNRTCPYSS